MPYKFLPHTADIKFQASGNSLEEAFASSALALKQTIAGKIKIKEKTKKEFKIKGKDKESLLYNFLEEFLYLLDAENFLLSKVNQIKITSNKPKAKIANINLINKKQRISEQKASQSETAGFHLRAVILGDKASDYKFTNSVKAITYNDMFVKKEKNKFITQVVLDV